MLIGEGAGLRVYAVEGGTVWLDGGAMFGVVPKPLWSREIEPDERNRIPLAMRCLLIESSRGRVLVDTAVGGKESDKFRQIYGIEDSGSPTRLETSLAGIGVGPEDVDVVVSTHLHFDHCGGNTRLDAEGVPRPTFPRARYVIRRGEWEIAHSDNRRIRASYLFHNFEPLAEAGVLELIDHDLEIVPGVRLVRTPGHTAHHQAVLIDAGSDTLFYPADLVPTSAHVRLPWIMAYDLEPLTTLAEKERWLTRAGSEGWRIIFEHDRRVVAARARPTRSGAGCELEDHIIDESGES